MVEYGVNVTNKFAFLGDDEDVHDPAEVLAKAEQAREREKASGVGSKAAGVKKPVAPVAAAKAPNAPSANKENVDVRRNQPKRDGPPRGGFIAGKDRGAPRGPRRNNEENSTGAPTGDAISDRFGENRPPRREPRGGQNFERRERGEGGGNNRGSFGRGGGAGGGGNRDGWQGGPRGGGPRFPRNENSGAVENNNAPVDQDGQPLNRQQDPKRFQRGPRNGGPRADRVSGSDRTAVRSVPKKDGAGKGNWGTDKDELTGQETEGANAEGDLNKTTDGAAAEGEHTNNAEETHGDEVEQEAEQIREITLEEWKAQQKSQQPAFNTRKAGEGGDQKVYQKLVLIKPVTDKEDSEEEDPNLNKRERREKTLNIEVSFNDSQRNRGGYREERGGYRGGGDRDDHRGSGGGGRGGGNFERGENRRSGGRPGGYSGGGGGARRNYNDGGSGGSGTGGRRQQQGGFNLTPESFPALGAR